MKASRLRSGLFTAALLGLTFLGWWYLAPTQLGGASSYVITRGVSMEPRFHTGDLAVVRPAAEYRAGDIVAYRSTVLHTVVLHRIVKITGGGYVFKGDHNNFLDPALVTRPELIGTLWLHLSRGGSALSLLHTPVAAASVCAGFALFLLAGAGERRRRGRRRRKGRAATRSGHREALTMNRHDQSMSLDNPQPLIAAAALAAFAFLVLGLVGFTRSVSKDVPGRAKFVQHVNFGYSARAPAGPVYPSGIVSTGDPIFLTLVHRLDVRIGYRLTSTAPHRLGGIQQTFLTVAGPSGWTRTLPLSPPRRFHGDEFTAHATLDVPRIQSLVARIGAVTGIPSAGATLTVVPKFTMGGQLAGKPINTSVNQGLTLTLTPQLLQVSGAGSNGSSSNQSGSNGASASGSSTTSGSSQAVMSTSQPGYVATAPVDVANTVGLGGVTVSVTALRWLSFVGLILSVAAGMAVTAMSRRASAFAEAARIQARYGHLIVPIVATADALSWAPYEVSNFKALVRLAESGDRLILHHQDDGGDTYLVNDDSTVYRYRIPATKVQWQEWEPLPEALADEPEVGQTS